MFYYLPINNNLQYSKRERNLSDIKFIVIHDTGNPKIGAGALNHKKYLDNATRQGSAHYYVDDKVIVQPIGDKKVAWSVGDTHSLKNRTRTDVNNSNSISIEMCINQDSDFYKMYSNTVELTKNLMKKFNIPVENVVRHYDVSGKSCPDTLKINNWSLWEQFKTDIQKPMSIQIDLSKTSDFEYITNVAKDYNDENNLLDCHKTSWEWGVRFGYVDGKRPNAPATRQEVMTIINRVVNDLNVS